MKIYAVGIVLVVLFTCQQLSKAEPSAEDEAKEIVHKIMQECIKESGISHKESKLIMADDMDNIAEKDFTPNMKCFLLCFYKRLGLVNRKGKPHSENLLKYMLARFEDHKHQVKLAMAKCASVVDPNPCEMVFKFEMCMAQNIDEKAG